MHVTADYCLWSKNSFSYRGYGVNMSSNMGKVKHDGEQRVAAQKMYMLRILWSNTGRFV